MSLRESQIRQLERASSTARGVAALARDSGLFLSAVQIGVNIKHRGENCSAKDMNRLL